MTFAQLNSSQRSILTMLCTGQTFNTAELGRGTVPKQDAQAAAQILMEMRDQGLIFSSQKAAGAQYASWRASDYGKKVFEGRPDENPSAYQPPARPSTLLSKKYVVYNSEINQVFGSSVSEEAMLKLASELSGKNKRVYYVAALVAIVRPVEQPTVTIERV